MQIDTKRIKGKTVENGLTGAKIAHILGIDPSTYYRKLGSGGGAFTITQAKTIAGVLKLTADEFNSIFFGA